MVSFWPDSIWTPEFTDLALTSPSPHRHLDSLAVAGAVAVLTKNTPITTMVVDTVRRHPAMLAQTALTLSHLSKGRFMLGLGAGELENTVPYGFDFRKQVSRFEESLKVIRLLWDTDGPVDFEGEFYHLHHARLDTEFYDGKPPPIWLGAGGPRSLTIAGRYADGWWPSGGNSPEEFADKLKVVRESAERAGRDPMAIVPAKNQICLIGDEGEIEEILRAPMVKSIILMFAAVDLRKYGYEHPLGPDWRGILDFNPATLTRERVVKFCEELDTQVIRDMFPVGTPKQCAKKLKGYIDAGAEVFKVMEYGNMAGAKFRPAMAQKVRDTEDELMRLCQAV
jgi:phthiodiolone/phenolphthiodiolone dimycocerosates ketoreductase